MQQHWIQSGKLGNMPPVDVDDRVGFNIVNADIPASVVIPFGQGVGNPAVCVVKPGEHVKPGTLIGRSSGELSSNVHASLQGVVREIVKDYLLHGRKTEAAIIDFEGSFSGYIGQWFKQKHWCDYNRSTILDLIHDAGIVGLGGAVFPTKIKFSVSRAIGVFVVNAVECEPYVQCDHALMMDKFHEIVLGMQVTRLLLNPEKVVLVVGDQFPGFWLGKWKKMLQDSNIEVHVVSQVYPQGNEKQIVSRLFGLEIPEGRFPSEFGFVISNVSTIFAIYEAVVLRKPLFERVITIAGKGVRQPGNYRVLMGCTVETLVKEVGMLDECVKIVFGGPMMGVAQYRLDTPITKGVTGILFLTEDEIAPKVMSPCIQCGECIRVCPVRLDPVQLYRQGSKNCFDSMETSGLFGCIECGCCDYVCPSSIPLVETFKMGKTAIRGSLKYVQDKIPILPLG